MDRSAFGDHGLTAAVSWLLAPFVFAAVLVAGPGWLAILLLADPPDALTRAMTAVFAASVGSMVLVARDSVIGGALAVLVGIMGVTGGVLLATSGQGDVVSTRWFPPVVVAVALTLTALSIAWIRPRLR